MASKVKAYRSLFDALCDLTGEHGTRAREAVDGAGEVLAPGVGHIVQGDVVGGIAQMVVAHRRRGSAPPATSLAFKALGKAGDPYPPELAALGKTAQSGVYVIREKSTRRTVYVGESHSGKLYATLTRHFQEWRRGKAFWGNAGFASKAHDPGVTYERGDVEVAVILTSDEEARDAQDALINEFRPRDNVTGNGDDDVPF